MMISVNGNGFNIDRIDFDDFWEEYIDTGDIINYLLEQYDMIYPKVQLPIGDFTVSELILRLYDNSRYELSEDLEYDIDNVYSDLKYELKDWTEDDEPINFFGYEITPIKTDET